VDVGGRCHTPAHGLPAPTATDPPTGAFPLATSACRLELRCPSVRTQAGHLACSMPHANTPRGVRHATQCTRRTAWNGVAWLTDVSADCAAIPLVRGVTVAAARLQLSGRVCIGEFLIAA
jgi:hypothetical protein